MKIVHRFFWLLLLHVAVVYGYAHGTGGEVIANSSGSAIASDSAVLGTDDATDGASDANDAFPTDFKGRSLISCGVGTWLFA